MEIGSDDDYADLETFPTSFGDLGAEMDPEAGICSDLGSLFERDNASWTLLLPPSTMFECFLYFLNDVNYANETYIVILFKELLIKAHKLLMALRVALWIVGL